MAANLWFEHLRLLADPTRLRILALLRQSSLSVAEIQQTLQMPQSRISTQLSLLRKGGWLQDRREGQKIFYSWSSEITSAMEALVDSTLRQTGLISDLRRDRNRLHDILKRRREQTKAYFNALAGRAGKKYCPGKSWQSLAHLFLELIPECDIADLGAGEGFISQLLARRARKVIAIDLSEKMVLFARQQARKAGIKNLEFRVGEIESPPINKKSVDLALFSQALHHAVNPEQALAAAYTILKPGGRVIILDLKRHHFDAARELYSDTWLGFDETELSRWLHKTGFSHISIHTVERETQPPHFQSLIATAKKLD